MVGPSNLPPAPPLVYAVSGSAAVTTANTLLYPIEVIITKLQAQSKQDATNKSEVYYTSFFDAVIKIVQAEGVPGLYSGLPGSLLSTALAGYCFNYWHSSLRQIYISSPRLPQPPGTTAELALAYGAGVLTVLVTNPLANVTTRQKTTPPFERKGLVGTARDLFQSGGPTRMWSGLPGSFLLCINPAITYGSIERLRRLLFQNRQVLKPWESFALGMISKAIAVIALHPVSVALTTLRARLPAARNGKSFESFVEALIYVYSTEGFAGLFKGLVPTLSKAVLMQGLLNILKERFNLVLTILYFRYFGSAQKAKPVFVPAQNAPLL